jgi:hypothetical protein
VRLSDAGCLSRVCGCLCQAADVAVAQAVGGVAATVDAVDAHQVDAVDAGVAATVDEVDARQVTLLPHLSNRVLNRPCCHAR